MFFQVATLLLLSQQEERHLLDSNVNSALQRKIEELQRNLLQVVFMQCFLLAFLAQIIMPCFEFLTIVL